MHVCKRMKTKLGIMCNYNEIFIAFVLFLTIFCDSTSSECRQLAPCICQLPDGSYYNLTALADKELLNVTDGNTTAYYKPCKNIPIPLVNDTTCSKGNGVSLCMHNNSTNVTLNLGTWEETVMKYSDKYTNPIFEIHHKNYTSVIHIICAKISQTFFQIAELSPNGEYTYFLISPYACAIRPHDGLSTGSILLILFFVFSGLYFIGGAIVLKTLRGATGWEMLPNHKFWCELPALVRDGVVFTLNCCRADSYERI